MTEEQIEQKAEEYSLQKALYCESSSVDLKEAYIAGATELQEEMKKDLVSKLKELISYSTSPSCTKGMELFIKGIEDWEFVK